MRYKILNFQAAKDIARSKLEGKTANHAQYEQEVGQGTALSDTVLKDIAREILRHKQALEKQGGDREKLDALAFEIVHSKLPQDPDLLGDGRFWIRFAVVFLFDVIAWRFPGKGATGFNLENLGIGASTRKQAENYLYKLWVRGELSRRPTEKDPYKLGRFGSIDFWTSHIHRQGFASCRNVALELIRFQYPPEFGGRPRLLPGEEDVAKGKYGVRTLVKRLRRLWATLEYTLLESSEIQQVIKDLSQGLTVSNG